MKTLSFLPARERFLPVKTATLLERMTGDPRLSPAEREQLERLLRMIAARFHFEFRQRLEELQRLYDPFDPDRDTLPLAELGAAELESQRGRLQQAFRELLLQCNFVEMSPRQIEECLNVDTKAGLAVSVDLRDYSELSVFYRGVKEEERRMPWWQIPASWWETQWHNPREKVQTFTRAALLVRPRNEPGGAVHLKLFKNVVAADLEMLLPCVRIRMPWIEQVKIGSSVAGGVGTAAWKAFTAAVISPWMFLTLLSAFLMASVKGFFSFTSSKNQYMQALSSSLYFQNLANNAGALAQLVDAAENEEIKEMLLAYYVLYTERACDYDEAGLDRRIEAWLKEQFGLSVDFEVGDALRKLREKGLLEELPGRGPRGAGGPPPPHHAAAPAAAEPVEAARQGSVLKVYDLPSALRRLDEIWDGYFNDSAARDASSDRLADGDWPPAYAARTAGDAASRRRAA